ncbi:Acidic leucine-rich nuclear phosphoprotein 32 family member A [Dirofilaria immitis]|nr:Acidic leucine-rich nuclear phosphoprotein 32 family member A [Dirofilaria immitis]
MPYLPKINENILSSSIIKHEQHKSIGELNLQQNYKIPFPSNRTLPPTYQRVRVPVQIPLAKHLEVTTAIDWDIWFSLGASVNSSARFVQLVWWRDVFAFPFHVRYERRYRRTLITGLILIRSCYFQMDKRIELELRGRDPSEVTELNLDNCRATAVSGLTEDFRSLETLSMINGLPPLPSLQRLDLSENRISGNLDQLLCCPHIEYLNLAELRSLDLFGCELATSDDYRKNVFETLPNLKYLDGYDINDEEAESDSEILQEGGDDEDDDDGVGDGLDDTDNDDEGNDDEEDSDVGLDYLQSSTVMQDEDETEDFAPGDDEETDEAGSPRGVKRKHERNDDDEDGEAAKREA